MEMVKDLSVQELRSVIRSTVEETLEDRLEDLEALQSKSYVHSIEEARQDAEVGRLTFLLPGPEK